MADSQLRLLLLIDYLTKHTDEKHASTVRDMVAHLELSGVSADRRSVRTDLTLLKLSGMDVRVRRRRANEYYLGSRAFERMELRLLADMVRSSRVLTSERSEELIEKLGSLTSRGESAWLLHSYCGANPQKTENDRAFLNAGRVLCALEKGVKLSFEHCRFTAKNALSGGEETIVNPYLLVYAEDNYYLIADHPAHEGFAHYRLDQMARVRALDEPAVPADPSFDAAAYARSVFSMVPAEQRWVRLAFDRQLTGCMVDRFGADVPIEQIDGHTCALYAPVRVSPPFFGWVFQFSGGVRILEPDDVRERMLLMLEAARKEGKGR